MTGAVFFETWKRTVRQILYWGVGLGVLSMYVVLVIPNVEALQQYKDLLETMPPVLLQAFGAKDTAIFATPEGFIAFSFLTYALLILLVFGVIAGLNMTANEEDEGILDLMLALPLPRWRIVAEKAAVYTLALILIVLIAYIGLFLGAQSVTLTIDMNKLVISGVNMVGGVWLVMMLTALLGVVIRRKMTALGVVTTFILVSYFINFLGNAASETAAAALRWLSFFRYADAQTIIVEGFEPLSVLILFGGAVACLAGTLWAFERRDIGV